MESNGNEPTKVHMREDLGLVSRSRWASSAKRGARAESTGMGRFRSSAEVGEESSWTELQCVGWTKKREREKRQGGGGYTCKLWSQAVWVQIKTLLFLSSVASVFSFFTCKIIIVPTL